MFFIEVIYSTYTHNTWYNKPESIKLLDWTLSETSKTKHLKTVEVIFLEWVIEKNGYYWMPSIFKVPHAYKVPPLFSLTKVKVVKRVKESLQMSLL